MFVEWIRNNLPAITPTQIPKCKHHFRLNWTWELYSVSHAFNVFYRIFLSYSITSASISLLLRIHPGFPGGTSGKEPANADLRDTGLIPGTGRSPGGGHGNTLQYSCRENPTDRSLVNYGPLGRKGLDTTEVTLACMHTMIYPGWRAKHF